MLEDNKDEHLVSWSPGGDAFTVKDMNEFTKVILPRMFKHSNFASFVRQLNKYDFHKIKNDELPGDTSQVRERFLYIYSPSCHLDLFPLILTPYSKLPHPTPHFSLPSAANHILLHFQTGMIDLISHRDRTRCNIAAHARTNILMKSTHNHNTGQYLHFIWY